MPYIWDKQSSLTRVHGNDVAPGEEFEPTDAELESFGDVIKEVEGGGSSGEDGDAETCEVVMTNDEVCGRELPCPYHSD